MFTVFQISNRGLAAKHNGLEVLNRRQMINRY